MLPALHLSDSHELLLRLRWLAILSERITSHLAVTGGVHTGLDAIRAIMAGADGVQMVSALLRNGPEHLKTVREEVTQLDDRAGLRFDRADAGEHGSAPVARIPRSSSGATTFAFSRAGAGFCSGLGSRRFRPSRDPHDPPERAFVQLHLANLQHLQEAHRSRPALSSVQRLHL